MADPVPLASGRFRVQRNNAELFLPFASNGPIDTRNPLIRRVVISLHGNGSHAILYRDNALESARLRPGAEAETLIVAPQFAKPADLFPPIPDTALLWKNNQFWGDLSVDDIEYPRPFRISSFAALDLLLQQILNRNLFPNLLSLVLVGHSGGGQFVNRYAGSSRIEDDTAGPLGVKVHYIPINPGNWMYLNNLRPSGDGFAVPDEGPCPEYNVYGLGLSLLDADYHIPRDRDAAEIQALYGARRITYLAGLDDNDPNHDSLPRSCGSMLQGQHRLERARNYFRHVTSVYGASIRTRQRLVEVPGVGHWGKGMMTSSAGVEAIYEPVQDFNAQVFELAPSGGLARLVDTWSWSNGWTQARTFAVGGTPYLFLLKELTGDVHVHALNSDGRVGTKVADYNWSAGWTTVSFYSLGGATYLLLLKASTGTVHIHSMNFDGSVGPRVQTLEWSPGWTTAQHFRVANFPFLFLLKRSSGEVHLHGVNSNGTVGPEVARYDWSGGWSSVCFFYRAGFTYLLLMKESDGTLHLHKMNLNGSVGTRIDVEDWSSGWTGVEPYSTLGASRLLFLKRATGRLELRQVNPDGTIGPRIEQHHWTPGWSSVSPFVAGAKPFLLAVKEQKMP